ncbi:MAG: phosphate acyltransferase PlsX [Defluviitaleaceae bacterium]|nr:phosphate acyltransferase PlsX [Defluviitaleaceae bacterium]MCL2261717.1 phosphate acyltransferase PlsX [Defluviitaleaceae bacterium]
MEKLTIAIDAMGGDLGASAMVKGAAMAMEDFPFLEPVLFGDEKVLFEEAKKYGGMKIVHAPTVILPSESPTLAFRRKKDSSIVMGLKYVKEGNAAGFVSAGSTGALLTGATVIIGRKPGVERPALGTLLPTKKGHVLLLDCGANMDCKPTYLAQFAQLGTEYMQKCMKLDSPRVGLINVGTEDEKGNAAAKEAFALLNGTPGFVGNIEGREILSGEIDVAVCDGFTGNVLLKFTEGFAKTMMGMVKEELLATTISKLGALMAKGAFKRLRKRFDYREVGGAPFLGLNHLVIKAHGSSDALAIKNAIRQCVQYQ